MLGKPAAGTFLDIGANDGITHSNSLFFEGKGWTGVCVEPHPTIFNTLKDKRSCHLLNACISDNDQIVHFLAVEGPANLLSGIKEFCDDHHLQRINNEIREKGGSLSTLEIEALSPTSLAERFNIRSIDYMSLDTEGCAIEILKAFDFTTLPVKVIAPAATILRF